ncbi:MAG: invasion associated locus B family protein [Magnetococcales bacterium]|nr:invasion associated locus B family protein [Magnetococcales bacterium]
MSHSVKLLLIVVAVLFLPFHLSHAEQKFTRSQVFGDWVLNCSKNDDPKVKAGESCVLQQKLLTEKGQKIIQMTIGMDNSKKSLAAVLSLPLGFYIPDGVKILIGSGSPQDLLVKTCFQTGCLGEIFIDRRMKKELSVGKSLKIIMVTGDRTKKLEFPMSLKGISEGLKSIK